MSITTYAQNFEDILLWRSLGHIPSGQYIDVGAHHPSQDSVSQLFYEHGWRGV
ncbi:methyltransferase, partial [Burkholderia cenocepacia]